MAKKNISAAALYSGEEICGWIYLLFQLAVLPSLLSGANRFLSHPLNQTELNFVFYLINFLCVIVIFHRFLAASAAHVLRHPAYYCQAIILGLVAYYACTYTVTWCVTKLDPGFANVNDASIAALSKGSWFLMAVGTVILVPPVEECFYRGLIFRALYNRVPWAAYVVSIAVFAAIHIIGYFGSATPLQLFFCFLQYLPAGLCLAWSYKKADTIFAPILIHAIINARSIGALR